MPDQPNIVLCLCDQLRAFEVGCYGNPVIRTPHVDRLADEGVRFATAMCQFPVCMASRSVLISGQYNRTCTGGVANVHWTTKPGDCAMPEYPESGRPHLRDETLPEVLRALGYETAVIGKWHIHSWPTEVGFETYLIPRVHHCHSGQSFTENGGPEFVPDGWSVEFEASRVEQFIAERRDAARPFFLYYSISPPHCPLADAPERIRTMYRPEEVPIRPNVDLGTPLANQDYWFRVYRWDFRYYGLRLPYTENLPDGYDLRHLIAEYYGATTWMDEAVGRMLGALDAAGLADDTIVVFCSDHGDNLGSLGLVQKGQPTEESARVPLVVRHPARLAPRVAADRVAGLVDLAPTLIRAAGGTPPAHLPGVDLLADEPRDHAIIETGAGIAVRSLDHLYALGRHRETGDLTDSPQQYFDLRDDPHQLNNLAGSGRQAETAARLDALLREWDRRTPWMRTV